MVDGIRAYCEGYRLATDSDAGSDYVLGADGVRPILQGLLVLLNGPSGRLDCGSFDTAIRDIAVKHGFADADSREIRD